MCKLGSFEYGREASWKYVVVWTNKNPRKTNNKRLRKGFEEDTHCWYYLNVDFLVSSHVP